MRPVARQLITLVSATIVALAILLAYFYSPWGVGSPQLSWKRTPRQMAARETRGRALQFVDVTTGSGLAFEHFAGASLRDIRQVMSPGFGLGDLNGDGRMDLFIPNSGTAEPAARRMNGLFLNRGGMQFERMPDAGGADSGEWGMGCALADYDDDGDLDIYVTALGPNRLYRNDGHARFEEVAASVGVADSRWSAGAAFADYDGDGDLDLYITNYVEFDEAHIPAGGVVRSDRSEPPAFSPYVFPAVSDALLRNDGDKFVDVTDEVGISDDSGKGMAGLFADLNEDRRPDLLVINDVSFNAFFRNVDGRSFADDGALSGLADPRSGMGIALGDYDNDGAFDVFSTHWQDESNVLYRNLSVGEQPGATPLFDDVTIDAGLAAPSMGVTGWGASWADFDLDGDLDLLVVNGYTSPAAGDATQCIGQPTLLFVNNNGKFVNEAATLGLSGMSNWAARGAAAADLDDDGDQDIVIATNNGPLRVFENKLNSGNWLKIRPVGGLAIGSVVRIRIGDKTQQRMILSGSSYLCSEPPEAHFGLGGASIVDLVEVHGPDGTVQRIETVQPGQTLVVTQP